MLYYIILRLQPTISAPEKPPRQPHRCALCKAEGHNKRNCPFNSIRTVKPAEFSEEIVTAGVSVSEIEVIDSLATYSREAQQGGVPLDVTDQILESRGSGGDENTNLELSQASSLGKRKILQEAQTVNKLMTKKQWEKEQSRLIGAHFPTSVRLEAFEGKPRDRGHGSNKRNWKRGSCKLCGKHLPNMCESCGVYLCIKNHHNQMNCWKRFHTRPTFSEPDDQPEAIAMAAEGAEEEEQERKEQLHAIDSDPVTIPMSTITNTFY